MNDELQKTVALGVVSTLLLALAIISVPRTPDAPVFKESGVEFYPAFKDTLAASSLEVVDYDEALASLRQFRVMLKEGRWVVPSKFDHPADAELRFSKTAAALMDLKRGPVRTDNAKDHEALGVLDPLNAGQALKGLGTRVIMKDKDDRVLCDYIFGKEVKDKKDTRFVRLPDQKRVYEVVITYQISSKFSDWVETDLLQVKNDEIKGVRLNTYVVDERRGQIVKEEDNGLTKDAGNQWKMEGLADTEDLNTETAWNLASALDELKIIDVRKKPEGLSKRFIDPADTLKSMSRTEYGTLVEKGFFPGARKDGSPDVFGKEGEIRVNCNDGVFYRIWFGDVIADADSGKDTRKDSHYLLIRTGIDEAVYPEPVAPKDVHDDGKPKTDEEKKKDKEDFDAKTKEREGKLQAARDRERKLAKRFADWYYVIPGDSFKKLHRTRAELVKPKASPEPHK